MLKTNRKINKIKILLDKLNPVCLNGKRKSARKEPQNQQKPGRSDVVDNLDHAARQNAEISICCRSSVKTNFRSV